MRVLPISRYPEISPPVVNVRAIYPGASAEVLETTVAASHLIFDGVMERHPKLKVVLPHAGGYLAHYWARMDHAHRARPDCHTVIKKAPTSYLKKIYFDTVVFTPHQLAELIRLYGPGQIIMGTDYPFDMQDDDPIGHLMSVEGLDASTISKIAGGNAKRLLGI